MATAPNFQQALEDAYLAALRSVVEANPSMTAADLSALISEHPKLAELTLGNLLGSVGAGTKPGAAKAKRPKAAPPKAKAGAPAEAPKAGGKRTWNVRTAEGRAALEAAVLETLRALGGKDIPASALRERLGGTAAQLRTTLNRLIEQGTVTFTGKARGTRYSLA